MFDSAGLNRRTLAPTQGALDEHLAADGGHLPSQPSGVALAAEARRRHGPCGRLQRIRPARRDERLRVRHRRRPGRRASGWTRRPTAPLGANSRRRWHDAARRCPARCERPPPTAQRSPPSSRVHCDVAGVGMSARSCGSRTTGCGLSTLYDVRREHRLTSRTPACPLCSLCGSGNAP